MFDRELVRREVERDQVSAWPPRVGRVERERLSDLAQLRRKLFLGDGLALLPLAVLMPDRPPPATVLPGRVDGDP
jgi:hypothetical protein